MDLLVFVQGIQTQKDLAHDERGDILGDVAHVLVDDFGEAASVHELDEHEQAVHVVVAGVVVDNVGVRTHGHDSSFDLDLVEDVLLGDLHDSDGPALVGVLAVEGLVDRAHGALAELLGEPIQLVGVFRLELDLGYLFIEIGIGYQRVLRDFLGGLQPPHYLDHRLRVLLDVMPRQVVLLEKFHHVVGEALDAHRAVQVHFQVQLVLEVGRSGVLGWNTC